MADEMLPSCLVVLSGGQDSTTCLFWAKQRVRTVHAVTFNYNQRHARELEAAVRVAEMAGVASHEVVDIGPILKGSSPLTDPTEHLEQYDDHDTMADIIGTRVELTFVPMRNALFLTLAANRAVCLNTYHIVTGVCEADNANYPDCRETFIESQQATVNEALGLNPYQDGGTGMVIDAPLLHMTKAESIQVAREIPGAYYALAYTHTAYDGAYPPLGKDHATVLRAHGFEQAGLPDPLIVRACLEGLMELPLTTNYDRLRNDTVQNLVLAVHQNKISANVALERILDSL